MSPTGGLYFPQERGRAKATYYGLGTNLNRSTGMGELWGLVRARRLAYVRRDSETCQSAPQRDDDGLRAVGDIELGENVVDVELDSAFGDE